jgi:acetyl-CoA carboxylase carboxyl transferase subunit alpha
MLNFKIIDGIVEEPLGGAHRDADAAIDRAGEVLSEALSGLATMKRQEIQRQRREKFLAIGRTIQ